MLLILAALAAQTMTIQERQRALRPSPVRFELVYRVAKIVCPLFFSGRYEPSIPGLFTITNNVLKGRTYLTGEEMLLLVDNCELYSHGRESR